MTGAWIGLLHQPTACVVRKEHSLHTVEIKHKETSSRLDTSHSGEDTGNLLCFFSVKYTIFFLNSSTSACSNLLTTPCTYKRRHYLRTLRANKDLAKEMTYLAVVIWLLWWCVMASAQPRLSVPKARHAVSDGRARAFGAEMHANGALFESETEVAWPTSLLSYHRLHSLPTRRLLILGEREGYINLHMLLSQIETVGETGFQQLSFFPFLDPLLFFSLLSSSSRT